VDQIKIWTRDRRTAIVFGAIIFLASTLSFAFGYLANREYDRSPIVIRACSDVATQKENPH